MAPRITIPDDYPRAISGTEVEDKVQALGEVVIYNHKAENREALIARIKASEAVINIRAYTHLDREVLTCCPKLKLISIWGTGTDNIDLEAARELGITITNTPGANALSVAEHTIALLLSLARQIPYLDHEIRQGNWPRGEMVQLHDKVLGLFGLGAIGKYVARMAKGLGMDLIAWTLHPSPARAKQSGVRFVSKAELLINADVISLHLRLQEETREFLKKEDFDLMKPTAFLVNTARGGLVETDALYNALQSKKIAGAALDVFDQEPLPAGDILATLPNVVMTPHNAGMTPDAIINGLTMAVENVESFFAGRKIDPAAVVVRGSR
ncbi:MAG: phosphoglycerate dehydrogenase [Desulfobacterales bacterium]|jgi:D-3-phosphoglycerate dehydrogenase